MYDYHESKWLLEPEANKRNKNIKGLELEVSDPNGYEPLDNLIDRDIVTVPGNEGYTNHKVVAERDGSVEFEIIFKADYIKNLMKEFNKVRSELNSSTITNNRGTSAHIHLNRAYLNNHINHVNLEITKTFEMLMPFMYMVSGRDTHYMNQWARSICSSNFEEELEKRAKRIQRIGELSYNRYNAVNLNPDKTVELRLFSNYSNFDYQTIKLFLDLANLTQEIAEEFQGCNYENEWENIIHMADNFMLSNTRRKKWFNKFNLDSIMDVPKNIALIQIRQRWDSIQDRIDRFQNVYDGEGPSVEATMSLLRLIRDLRYNYGVTVPCRFSLNHPDYQEIVESIQSLYEQTNNIEL